MDCTCDDCQPIPPGNGGLLLFVLLVLVIGIIYYDTWSVPHP